MIGFAAGVVLGFAIHTALRSYLRSRQVCAACGGTGVIDTGNNELPCDCEAGDRQIFNVSTPRGVVQMSGKELRDVPPGPRTRRHSPL